jgi:hypothetical protein
MTPEHIPSGKGGLSSGAREHRTEEESDQTAPEHIPTGKGGLSSGAREHRTEEESDQTAPEHIPTGEGGADRTTPEHIAPATPEPTGRHPSTSHRKRWAERMARGTSHRERRPTG